MFTDELHTNYTWSTKVCSASFVKKYIRKAPSNHPYCMHEIYLVSK